MRDKKYTITLKIYDGEDYWADDMYYDIGEALNQLPYDVSYQIEEAPDAG